MKAKIRGTEIYFDIAGMQIRPEKKNFKEYPVLFMLHGGPGGDHSRFKQHSLALQESAQLIFIDHRGCGRSKKTKAAEYNLENNIEDIEALRKHLGLEKICVLGTSYGGMVAQGYAIRYGKHINKLVLVATAPSYHLKESAKDYLAKHGNTQQIAMSEHLWNGTFKDAKHVAQYFKIMDSLYSLSAKKKAPRKYFKSQTRWCVEALNEFAKSHFNFINKLKKIKCPTLILAGQEDWVCRPEQSKLIAEKIPHSILKIFKNCGHSIAMDAHEAYIKTIQKFLSS
jgi:proline iminopeptidase